RRCSSTRAPDFAGSSTSTAVGPGYRPFAGPVEMVLAYPLLLGLLVAPLLGGDLRRLADLRLRGVSLLYLALGLQLVAFPVHALPVQVGDSAAVALWLVSYVLLAAATALNIRRPGILLIAAGVVANVA